MLDISPSSLQALRASSEPGFRRRLAAILADEAPHFLPCFPPPVRERIVRIMADRAARWGLVYQDAVLAYCRAMIAIAADFDAFGPIHAFLRGQPDLNGDFPQVVEAIPPDVRAQARAAGSSLAFFVPEALRDAPLVERTAAAITLVLHDRPEANSSAAAASAAMADAEALGLGGLADGPLVCAAARAFWGERFAEAAWYRDAIREGWPPAGILELVRLRLALEFGRFV